MTGSCFHGGIVHVKCYSITTCKKILSPPFLSSFPRSFFLIPLLHPYCSYCSENDYSAEFDYFLRGKESLRMDIKVPDMAGLAKEQV